MRLAFYLLATLLLFVSTRTMAECVTTFDCASAAVKAADDAQRAVKSLQDRVDSLEEKVVSTHAGIESLHFDCIETRADGRIANCPAGKFAISCSAGMNKASHSINNHACITDQSVDWTAAWCCKLALTKPFVRDQP